MAASVGNMYCINVLKVYMHDNFGSGFFKTKRTHKNEIFGDFKFYSGICRDRQNFDHFSLSNLKWSRRGMVKIKN